MLGGLLFPVVIFLSTGYVVSYQTINLNAGNTTVFDVQFLEKYNIKISFSSPDTYVTLNVHTYDLEASLSNLETGHLEEGTDIGVLVNSNSKLQSRCRLQIIKSSHINNTKILLKVSKEYDNMVPMPGGGAVLKSPTVHLTERHFTFTLEFAPAKPGQHILATSYKIYQIMFEDSVENYFKTLTNYYTDPSFKYKARLLDEDVDIKYKLRRRPWIAGLYFIEAVTLFSAHHASYYVPTVVHSCHSPSRNESTCIYFVSESTTVMFFVSLGLLFFGFLLGLGGHDFFRFGQFMSGHMLLSVILMYVMLLLWGLFRGINVLFWTSLALGLVGGAVITISWNLHGIPMIAVIPSGLLLGWLVSSVLFNITWIGNIHAFEMGETYAIVFLLICLAPLVVPCRNNKWLNCASFCVIGAFFILIPFGAETDNGVLTQIPLQSLLKAVLPSYRQAIPTFILDRKDYVIMTFWAILTAAFLYINHRINKGKPDFPETNRRCCRRRRRSATDSDVSVPISVDENTPLLGSETEFRGALVKPPDYVDVPKRETPPRYSPPPSYTANNSDGNIMGNASRSDS